ncbi:MAG TPA: Ku protein [Candidatus Binatia bacterium]|nr:Ku protein [Candidatus Binatia bacterium]
MERALWKGSISFGLVEIPVRLRPAVKTNELSFSLLDRKDFSPVGNKRYNKNSGKDVPWDEVVRGFEFEPDEYVVLSDEELHRANVKASETIEIVQFVQRDEIDPVYYETPYYVAPLRTGSKSYALLRDALERSDLVGIARVVLRTRQRLAALLVRDRMLVLDVLRYAHELRSMDEIAETPKSKGSVSATEIRMARELIQGMKGKWDPTRFKDEYRDDVMALVRRKVKAGQIHTILEPARSEAPRKDRSEVMDLMPLLRKSLAAHEAARRPARKKPQRSNPTRRRRRSA